MLTFQIYFIAFFVTLIASRVISNRALKNLSSDQKAALVDAFSDMRMYSMIPFVAIIVAYFVLIQHPVMSFQSLTILYLAAFVIYIGLSYWFSRRRLLQLELPKAYLTQIGIARVVRLLGLALLMVALFSFGIF